MCCCSNIRKQIDRPADFSEFITVELVEQDPDERIKPLQGIYSDD